MFELLKNVSAYTDTVMVRLVPCSIPCKVGTSSEGVRGRLKHGWVLSLVIDLRYCYINGQDIKIYLP